MQFVATFQDYLGPLTFLTSSPGTCLHIKIGEAQPAECIATKYK